MINLLHIVSVPILAFNIGFVNPHIDLNYNIRETYRTQVIQQKQGTDKKRSEHKTDNFKAWYKQRKENRKDTKSKSEKLESSRTRRGNRDFKNSIREIYTELYGDQRKVAQFYVGSWFITCFSLDLDDNTLLRVKDVYAKAISEVGLVTKGTNRRGRLWREKSEKLKKIYSTFDHELQKTLDVEQYKQLIKMTKRIRRERNVDKGET